VHNVDYFRWFLPPRPGAGPRAKPYLSGFKMNAAEAAAVGALRPDPSSRELRELPDSPDKQQRTQTFYPSAGHDGVKPPRAK